MTIDNKYNFGQIVYLNTDVEQKPRMVTGFVIRKDGFLYYISSGETETSHYEYEMSSDKNILMTLDS